jgi:RHS repeat-associated protein
MLTRTVAGRTWSYRRDAAGQITGMTYPNGLSSTLTYDAAHRLTDATDSLGIHRHRVLTAAGDVLQVQLFDATHTLVRQQSYGADALGRITSTTDANNQTQTLSYDNDGNPVGSTDPLGRVTAVNYDALNRPVSLTDPAGEVTAVQFNPFDQPTQITAPNGALTQYSYDSFRQLVQEVSPDRGTSTTTYSAAGLPTARLDARGITASATYDALNRITQLNFTVPGNTGTPPAWLQLLGSSILSDNVSFTYDQGTGCTFGIGRLCARQDQSGTERYAYDTFGNLTRQTDTLLGFSYATQYAYDTANQLSQMTYPDGRVVNYARDELERVTSVQSTVNRVASPIVSALQYRADGSPASLTFGNGLTETRGYDPVGRLISQIVGSADSRAYGFDAVGNMTAKQTNAESDQFDYDALNRLSAEQRTQGTSLLTNAFSYDPNGNRLSENRNGTSTALSYVADSNRLIQDGASALTLDAAGNTTADNSGARKFYYSAAGHLQWIGQNGVPIAAYLYNALGQRTGKLTLQGISLYHYDILGRLISETTIGSQPSRDYVWVGGVSVAQIDHWLPIGNMLKMAHCSVGGDGKIDWVTYLHTDGLGTPRIGTDVAQNVVWRWDGEAFGETAPNQTVPVGAYPVLVNLRNPGQYFDQETGLFYNVARYYNPQTGRYISSDPIGLGGGLNTYSYARQSPLNFADPRGLWGWVDIVAIYTEYVQPWVYAAEGALWISGQVADWSPGIVPSNQYQFGGAGAGGSWDEASANVTTPAVAGSPNLPVSSISGNEQFNEIALHIVAEGSNQSNNSNQQNNSCPP